MLNTKLKIWGVDQTGLMYLGFMSRYFSSLKNIRLNNEPLNHSFAGEDIVLKKVSLPKKPEEFDLFDYHILIIGTKYFDKVNGEIVNNCKKTEEIKDFYQNEDFPAFLGVTTDLAGITEKLFRKGDLDGFDALGYYTTANSTHLVVEKDLSNLRDILKHGKSIDLNGDEKMLFSSNYSKIRINREYYDY